jgi:hypothetical protein
MSATLSLAATAPPAPEPGSVVATFCRQAPAEREALEAERARLIGRLRTVTARIAELDTLLGLMGRDLA